MVLKETSYHRTVIQSLGNNSLKATVLNISLSDWNQDKTKDLHYLTLLHFIKMFLMGKSSLNFVFREAHFSSPIFFWIFLIHLYAVLIKKLNIIKIKIPPIWQAIGILFWRRWRYSKITVQNPVEWSKYCRTTLF